MVKNLKDQSSDLTALALKWIMSAMLDTIELKKAPAKELKLKIQLLRRMDFLKINLLNVMNLDTTRSLKDIERFQEICVWVEWILILLSTHAPTVEPL